MTHQSPPERTNGDLSLEMVLPVQPQPTRPDGPHSGSDAYERCIVPDRPTVASWTWRARHHTPADGVGPVMDVQRRLHLEDGMPQPTHNPGGWTHTEPPLPWEPEVGP